MRALLAGLAIGGFVMFGAGLTVGYIMGWQDRGNRDFD